MLKLWLITMYTILSDFLKSYRRNVLGNEPIRPRQHTLPIAIPLLKFVTKHIPLEHLKHEQQLVMTKNL